MESSFMTDIYTSQIVPNCMYLRDMYVAGTVAGMTSEDGRTDGRTDTTGHFTPQTVTSPSRFNSVKPRTGRELFQDLH